MKIWGPGSDVNRQKHRHSPYLPAASNPRGKILHGQGTSLVPKGHFCRGTTGTQTMGVIGRQEETHSALGKEIREGCLEEVRWSWTPKNGVSVCSGFYNENIDWVA